MYKIKAVALLISAVLLTGAFGQVTTDQAATTPWSASYYPQAVGALFKGYLPGEPAPLQKYDQYMAQGTKATDWEQKCHGTYIVDNNCNIVPGPNGNPQPVPGWWGYCHAWSAAALLLDEPQFSRYGKDIVFRVGDIKGLLMVLYYATLPDFLGERCNSATCSNDDPTPIEFEAFLMGYISGQKTGKKTAVVMDKNNGPDVWNQPLYKYTRTEQKTVTSTGWIKKIAMTVEYANEYGDYDKAGTSSASETYYYTLEDTDGNDKADKSQWTDSSWIQPSKFHPDFLWYPTMLLNSPNPYVKKTDVAKILSLPKVGLLVRDTTSDKGVEPSTGYTWHSPDLWTQPAQPQPGQSVTLYAKVHNESGLDLTGSTVKFYRSAPNLGSMDPSLLGSYKVGEVSNVAIGHYQNADVSVNWNTPTNVATGDGCILVAVDDPADQAKGYYPTQDNNVAARNFFNSTIAINVARLNFPVVLLNPHFTALRADLRVAMQGGRPGWTVALLDRSGRSIAKKQLRGDVSIPFANVLVQPREDATYRLQIIPPRDRRIGDTAQIFVSSRLVWTDEQRKPETNGITLQVSIRDKEERHDDLRAVKTPGAPR